MNSWLRWLSLFFVLACYSAGAQNIRISFVPGPFTTNFLVRANDTWHFWRGNKPPPPNWHSLEDSQLIGWETGPGGFGYGDGDDATELNDMAQQDLVIPTDPPTVQKYGGYTTVYIRRTFTMPAGVGPNDYLYLMMDYDDGFIAYIDGVHRARRNAPLFQNQANSEGLWNASAPAAREPSAGGGAIEVIELGPASELAAGPHKLAIVGYNAGVTSSDFSLIPHLFILRKAPRTDLVRAADTWHYFKGTREPDPAAWKTVADTGLTADWLTGPGGIGYGDGDDATVLSDMQNNYTTLYMRRSFTIAPGTDPLLHLVMSMDFDDAFIAWIDGKEVWRFGAPAGAQPPFNSVGADHEASAGGGAVAFRTLGRGLVLTPGSHVLSIMGFNASIGSSDFSMIPNLFITEGAETDTLYRHFTTNRVVGRVEGASAFASVTFNGIGASYNTLSGLWEAPLVLNPMMNRVRVEVMDGGLFREDVLVVYENAATIPPSTINANTTWNPASGVVKITNNVTVAANRTLTISPGAVVVFYPGASLMAGPDAVINATGAANNPVYLLPADGYTSQGGAIGASGANGTATLRMVDLAGVQAGVTGGGTLTIEDSVVRDLRNPNYPIITANGGGKLNVRRTRAERYSNILLTQTLVEIEHSIFQSMDMNGISLNNAPSGSIIRQVMFRNGNGASVNGVLLNNSRAQVERCHFENFGGHGILMTRCPVATIYGNYLSACTTGLGVADGTIASIYNNTILNSTVGLKLFQLTPGQGFGRANAYNLIIWQTSLPVEKLGTSILDLTYSALQMEPVHPGTGNTNLDPMFIDPSDNDYRPGSGSPARKTGVGGIDMGAVYPVGGLPADPTPLTLKIEGNSIRVQWTDNANNEGGYILERSSEGFFYSSIATLAANTTQYLDQNIYFPEGNPNQALWYRARGTNWIGVGLASLPASTQQDADTDGDGMPDAFEQLYPGILDPNNPADAHTDSDGDGMTNLQEYLAGTNPSDANDRLRIDLITRSGNTVTLDFKVVQNKSYQIESTDSLSPANWVVLKTLPPALTTGTVQESDTLNASVRQRYYRLVLPNPAP